MAIYLFHRKHELTPDLFHFVTCANEETQHVLWLSFVLFTFRKPYCMQDLVVACVELIVANALYGSLPFSLVQMAVFFIGYCVIKYEYKVLGAVFLGFYFSLNFWVNLTDFLYTGLLQSYYHDDFFTTSFSYKVHQAALCLIVAFVFTELIQPRHSLSDPGLLTFLFRMTVPICFSMLVAFTYELTWYASTKRLKVFKTEICKVLLTVVYVNFMALMLMQYAWWWSEENIDFQKRKERSMEAQRSYYSR